MPDYLKHMAEGSYVVLVTPLPAGATVGTGHHAMVVTSGATVHEAVKAAQQPSSGEGLRVKVINVVSLNKIQKPEGPFVREYLEDNLPIITVHDAEPNALGHRVKDAVNSARMIGRKPGITSMQSLGVNLTPYENHVGSGTNEENYKRNQLDAAGIVAALKKIISR